MGLALSDYQEVARDFLGDSSFAGLFDSPGLGKTPPTIVAAYQRVQETGRPSLITAPAYLLDNWEYEIGRFAPEATVTIANGKGRQNRSAALAADTAFILTSYNNWSAGRAGSYHYPELHESEWGSLVYDEAHRLRGRNSNATRHVFELRKTGNANRKIPVWMLSGTPIPNNPGDVWPFLYLYDRRRFRSYWNFVNEWCKINKTPWATEVGQLRRGLDEEFQELLGEFSMRRTLQDIPQLQDLAEVHKDFYVTMPESVRKTITKARKEYRIEHPDLDRTDFVSGGGALYSKLRMLATAPPTREKPKIDFVCDYAEDHPGQLVVYVWYKSSAVAVADAMSRKRPVTVITGDVNTSIRQELVNRWKTQPDGVIVATISALKEGISLTTASTVVFLEHSELPADQEQCVARLKRRGQQSLVNVCHVWARGTPDIAIKRALTDREYGLRRALTTWLREED